MPSVTDPAAGPDTAEARTSASGPAAVVVGALEHRYGDREALKGVDLAVAPGSVHALLGPNGSGKSTLFKVLTTIVAPQRGHAAVLGHDLAGDPMPVRRRIGVVFQSPALDKKLSVRANLRYAGHLQGMSGTALDARIDAVLDSARLAERAADKVETLSGGLRRRVELAKSLLHEPAVLLLDEPSTGLDPGARRDFWEMVRAQENRPTVLFTTHLMDEADLADRITLLHEGLVVAEGTPRELKSSVGGEVLEVEAREPERAAAFLRERGLDPKSLDDGRVRARAEGAHRSIGGLLESLGDDLVRVSVSQPSLEDVFLERTGRRLDGE